MQAPSSPLILIDQNEGVVRIDFQLALIDETNFLALAIELEPILRVPTPQTLILDFHAVQDVDDLGVMLIQSIQESIKEVGGTVRIRGCGINRLKMAKRPSPARDLDPRQTHTRPRYSTSW